MNKYSPYHFNAKEVDPETGYHYYGARYYNSNLSVWISVDPKADAFPQATPYNAFLNNPIMMVDPGGDSTWVVENANSYDIYTTIEFSGDALYKNGELRKTAQARMNRVTNEIMGVWDGSEYGEKEVNIHLIVAHSEKGGSSPSYDQIELRSGVGRSSIGVFDRYGNKVDEGKPTMDLINGIRNGANWYRVSGIFYTNTRSGTFAHEYGHMLGYWTEDYVEGESNYIGVPTPKNSRVAGSIMHTTNGETMPHIFEFIFGINKPE